MATDQELEYSESYTGPCYRRNITLSKRDHEYLRNSGLNLSGFIRECLRERREGRR